ncbi:MAG: hypothetical protein PUP46_07535 [Endozoicomonas sp. (ex Botrylloides leachii)]|nr:hypothetical protein [Endozoicomonas sp. (ex Botrylloides leachii)]
MTKKSVLALTILAGGVLAVWGGIVLWSGNHSAPDHAATNTSQILEQQPVINHSENAEQNEVDVTRIIIEGSGKSGEKIHSILSEKVIVNDKIEDKKQLQAKDKQKPPAASS